MKTTRIIVNSTPGYIIEASPCPSLYGNLKNLICFRRLGSLSGTPVCEKKRSQEDCPLGGYCPEGRRQSFAPDLRNALAWWPVARLAAQVSASGYERHHQE
jgi:hypothetical protein